MEATSANKGEPTVQDSKPGKLPDKPASTNKVCPQAPPSGVKD